MGTLVVKGLTNAVGLPRQEYDHTLIPGLPIKASTYLRPCYGLKLMKNS